MIEKKKIAILGSTGSVGQQTLSVISNYPEKFEISLLTAQQNSKLLIEQAIKFQANTVVIGDESLYNDVEEVLWKEDIKTYAGEAALLDAVQMDEIDLVIVAIVGYAALLPTVSAIQAGKNIGLANKEALVVAGEIITKMAQEKGVNIFPIDSEHSAIFQCIVGEFHNPIEKVILTASGGPFRGCSLHQLKAVTKTDALKHPNWNMGDKITVDSASMMNKGLEVIEAKWLFGLNPEQIEVIVHPESIIHSMVQFEDGVLKAQMGLPDMKLPIQFALTYPKRFKADYPRFSFIDYPTLNFEKVDLNIFDSLNLAYEMLDRGGNMCAVLNAVNEVSVQLFLTEKISFLKMAELNRTVCEKVEFVENPSLDDLFESNKRAREIALKLERT